MNASPDSPLLLKSSQESCCVQGRLGPTRGKKEAMGGRYRKSEVPESDFLIHVTLALCGQPRGQLPVSQLALASGDRDPDLTDEASPHGSARTSLTSPRACSRPQFLFDLNLLQESTDAQSTPSDEKDRKLGQTPYDHAAAYDGSSQSETAKGARTRRLEIYRMKNDIETLVNRTIQQARTHYLDSKLIQFSIRKEVVIFRVEHSFRDKIQSPCGES